MNDTTACSNHWPPWALMWLLAAAMFAAGKAATLFKAARARRLPSLRRSLEFALLWPGMDVRPFLATAGTPKRSRFVSPLFRRAVLNTLLGVFLLWGAARFLSFPLAAGWCGMAGLNFLLHFGLFGLVCAWWQSRGLLVQPLMDCPVAALSPSEFWGRRWNRSFRDLVYPLVFRPLAGKYGSGAALWITFALSGAAHELVISVPAGAGFGLPSGYFLLQALSISLENRLAPASKAKSGIAKARAWLFTHAFTAGPAFFLFHPPFVHRVMIPFFQLIGALP